MCFTVNDKWMFPQVAEKDIVCYKILRENQTSPFLDFQYIRNEKTQRVKLEAMSTYGPIDTSIIIYGYHSYKSLKSSWINYLPKWDQHATYKMIIPKGTTYYENTSEYVSETIILKRKKYFNLF